MALITIMMALTIVRRADVADTAYHIAASAYPAVFPFPVRGECAATLIDSQHALTAAHCFSPGTAGVSMPMTVTLSDAYPTPDASGKAANKGDMKGKNPKGRGQGAKGGKGKGKFKGKSKFGGTWLTSGRRGGKK